jgi:mono/diheme cytochrome c family protein
MNSSKITLSAPAPRPAATAPRGALLALSVTFLLALASGCGFPKSGPAPQPVTPATVEAARTRWPDASEAQLAAGRELFLAKCNSCHSYPDLHAVTDDKWPETVKRMGEKAKLDAAQTESVLRFVLSSGGAPAAAPAAASSAH